jgi:transposase
LTRRLVRLGVRQVAIERPDGPVVEALLAAGLEVVVIPGRQVKTLRGRHGTAGNNDDRCSTPTCSPTRSAPTGIG